MNATTSTLFLRNLTNIDHAFIDSEGNIRGGSYHLSVNVTGNIEEEEQVVIDFSRVKKQIKNIVDHNDYGFDHKLWLIKGFSNFEISNLYRKFKNDQVYFEVKTPKMTLTGPKNAFLLLEHEKLNRFDFKSSVEQEIKKALEITLREINGFDLSIDVFLSQNAFSDSKNMFNYVHGLKNSSAWSCQNMFHGHTSFVEVYDDEDERVLEMEKIIAYYLNNSILIFEENQVKNEENTDPKIQYTSERGFFSMSFHDQKTIVMKKETTIENIVEHVSEVFKELLNFYCVKSIYISEGLQKGAIKYL